MLVNRRSGSERARPRRCIVRRSETVANPWQQGVCHGVLLKKSRKRTRQRNTFPKSTKARKGKRTPLEFCSGILAPREGSVAVGSFFFGGMWIRGGRATGRRRVRSRAHRRSPI